MNVPEFGTHTLDVNQESDTTNDGTASPTPAFVALALIAGLVAAAMRSRARGR